jgi:pyruvate/2-oxoglutarate/acetoin dehydrogenase E1 component
VTRRERVAENLNRALRALLDEDPCAYVIGEDIADPYGGAFKITAGLSSRHPERVLSTPLSEGGFTGFGAGLALAGNRVIVEVMFGDFAALAFDQLLNFASKSVTMYGRTIPVKMVMRCPSGGNRAYGPTHSQSLQKHFIGIPGLYLYELSPFHDNQGVLASMLERGHPAMLFEDKVLYTQQMYADGVVDDLFRFEACDGPDPAVRVFGEDGHSPDWVIIAAGGMVSRALAASWSLLVDLELTCELLVPSRLYPFDVGPLLSVLSRAGHIAVIEDGTAGGTWGESIAHQIHQELWGKLRHPVQLVSAPPVVIPAASHLEREVLVQDTTIYRVLAEASR